MVDEPDPRVPDAKQFRERLQESHAKAAALIEGQHPADVAGWFQDVDEDDAWQVFSALEAEAQAGILEYAPEEMRDELVSRLSAGDLSQIVDELPADKAVDVLAVADQRVSADVLESIPGELASELRELSSYPPESAGGIMTSEYVAVSEGTRLGDAIKLIKEEGDDAEEDLGVFVTDADGKPVGYLHDRDLLTHSIHSTVDEVMVPPITIRIDEDQEEAAGRIAKYGLQALAVVDPAGVLLGVISSEDAQEVFETEVAEDILRMVGTKPSLQPTRLPVLRRVRRRLPLMVVTVLGGLATAQVLGWFLHAGEEAGTGAVTAILRYLPIVIGLAGNVGIQSSTILVRGFATGEVEPEREGYVLRSEVAVGLMLGLICGAVTALVAGALESGSTWLDGVSPLLFGAVVGAAIAMAVTWAAVLGCLIPIVCRRNNIDPAIVAGPFLVCLSDVSGALIYVGVAATVLTSLLA